jgi:hypothetical protein
MAPHLVHTRVGTNSKTNMRIDNYRVIPNRPPTPKESAFWKKLTAIVVKGLDMEYADVVHAYRQLEEEFINDSGNDVLDPLETKRHIAECILRAAHDAEQPFEVCRDNWDALVELGFSSIDTFCNMAWFYADSCLFNAQYDAGIDVLDMVIAEIHRRLDEPGLICQKEKYYDQELDSLETLREGLIAYKSSEAEGDAWDERRESESDARYEQESSPQGRQKSEIICKLFGASRPIRKNASDLSHAEMVCEYQKAEADFLARVEGDDKIFVPDVHCHFATAILEDAHERHEAFEVCETAWNELIQWGFPDLELRCGATRVYGECCLFNGQPDAGLAVVNPLLVDLQKHIAEGTDTEMPRQRYLRKIARLTKLRDELLALRQPTPPKQ